MPSFLDQKQRSVETWWRRRRDRDYYSESEPCLPALSSFYLCASCFPDSADTLPSCFLVTPRHLGEILGRFRIKLISNSSGKCRSPQRLWPEPARRGMPRGAGNEQRQGPPQMWGITSCRSQPPSPKKAAPIEDPPALTASSSGGAVAARGARWAEMRWTGVTATSVSLQGLQAGQDASSEFSVRTRRLILGNGGRAMYGVHATHMGSCPERDRWGVHWD